MCQSREEGQESGWTETKKSSPVCSLGAWAPVIVLVSFWCLLLFIFILYIHSSFNQPGTLLGIVGKKVNMGLLIRTFIGEESSYWIHKNQSQIEQPPPPTFSKKLQFKAIESMSFLLACFGHLKYPRLDDKHSGMPEILMESERTEQLSLPEEVRKDFI